MDTRMRSLDRKLAKTPICGMRCSEDVRGVLFTLYPRIVGGYGRGMHSFFKESRHNRISMEELLEKLPHLKALQEIHDEQHLLDPDYCRDLHENGTYTCWHCATIAQLRVRNPSLLR